MQAISARASGDLWHEPQLTLPDLTPEQIAQQQANRLQKLGKRISGNFKAKGTLNEAANAWIAGLGQHEGSLTVRIKALAATNVQELQADTLTVASVQVPDQITQTFAAMGPVWNGMQEAELVLIAAALRD